MKKTILLLCMSMLTFWGFAQAPVPTAWDCSGTLPTGWTENGTAFYTSSSYYVSAPSALKLDGDGDYLEIWLNDAPGALTYSILGTGSTWDGIFKTQESVDGTTWTDMRTFSGSGGISTSGYTLFSDVPNTASRYLRFYYTDKISGSNVGVDDISVSIPSAGPEQEIAVDFGGTNVANNGTIYFNSPVSTPYTLNLNVANLGTDSVLTLAGPSIGGAAAADYSITAFPASVAGTSSDLIQIDFTPSASGTRLAQLQFTSNDADESNFTINLNGIGGLYATEPASNPMALNFSSVKAYSMVGTLTASGADGYIILRKAGSAVTETPVDGETYDKGVGIGAAKVFYVGDGSGSILLDECEAGITYHYAVFAYNGVGVYTNYKQATPLIASRASGSGAPGSFYGSLDPASATFLTDLSALINPHFQIYYSNYKTTIIDNYLSRDTTGDERAINGDYSNTVVTYTPPFDFVLSDCSREHRLPSSWMPTFGIPSHEDYYAYSDLFNLAFVNQSTVNSTRSNHPYGYVVTPTTTYGDFKFGKDADGHDVAEPRDDFKGDAARAIFYMCTAYNNLPNKLGSSSSNVSSWAWDTLEIPATFTEPAKILSSVMCQDLLKKWAADDPPSPEEIARNEFIFDQQGNRNPYIDHPEWLCWVNFNTMTKMDSCHASFDLTCEFYNPDGINDQSLVKSLSVYPNPATDQCSTEFELDDASALSLSVYSKVGTLVYQKDLKNISLGKNHVIVPTSNLASGSYIVRIGNGNNVSAVSLEVKH